MAMKTGPLSGFQFIIRSGWSFLLLLGFLSIRSFADVAYRADEFTMKEVVPQKSYDLRYLGCKIHKVAEWAGHTGLFLFTWKGDKPTEILGSLWPDRKTFHAIPEFALHHEAGWTSAGAIDATGAEWIKVTPGEVIAFTVDLDMIEKDHPGFIGAVKGADRAHFHLDSKDGQLSSDDIILPLIPKPDK